MFIQACKYKKWAERIVFYGAVQLMDRFLNHEMYHKYAELDLKFIGAVCLFMVSKFNEICCLKMKHCIKEMLDDNFNSKQVTYMELDIIDSSAFFLTPGTPYDFQQFYHKSILFRLFKSTNYRIPNINFASLFVELETISNEFIRLALLSGNNLQH